MIERTPPPKFENAPGLAFKPRKGGWEARWQARTDLVTRGYEPKSVRICFVSHDTAENLRPFIAHRCQLFQDDMLTWAHGGVIKAGGFSGTLRDLIACYQSDPVSPYQKVRYVTRLNYDTLAKILVRDHGGELVKDMRPRTILAWHEEWSKGGIPRAHALVSMLRIVLSFGAILLEDDDCGRVRGLISGMKFKMGEPRDELITFEQANMLRAKAHELGHHSIALAQAFQFECTLRQKDVIGEWVPIKEKGTTDVVDQTYEIKWLRGIRWSEIDQNLILVHETSKKNKEITVDLRLAPMVMEELALLGERPLTGPLIVEERTSLPWRNHFFRRKWRDVARACGIPDAVKNMDSRAGAITEGTDFAPIEDVRHAAAHSNSAMTARYSRDRVKKTARVMKLRVEGRNKTGTE